MNCDKMNKCETIGLLLVIAVAVIGGCVCCAYLKDDWRAMGIVGGLIGIVVCVLAWTLVALQRETVNAYYGYQKSREEARKQEYLFSTRLVELVKTHAKQCSIVDSKVTESHAESHSAISLSSHISFS